MTQRRRAGGGPRLEQPDRPPVPAQHLPRREGPAAHLLAPVPLGCGHVDYTEDFAEGQRQDLVLDIAGRPTLARLRRALTPKGAAVLVGGEDGVALTGGMNRQLRATALSPFAGQRLVMFIAKERATDLERLGPTLEAGTVRPYVDRTFPLDQAPEAMRHLESGDVRGKVAVSV